MELRESGDDAAAAGEGEGVRWSGRGNGGSVRAGLSLSVEDSGVIWRRDGGLQCVGVVRLGGLRWAQMAGWLRETGKKGG